jgi:hypothetical protein
MWLGRYVLVKLGFHDVMIVISKKGIEDKFVKNTIKNRIARITKSISNAVKIIR